MIQADQAKRDCSCYLVSLVSGVTNSLLELIVCVLSVQYLMSVLWISCAPNKQEYRMSQKQKNMNMKVTHKILLPQADERYDMTEDHKVEQVLFLLTSLTSVT